MMAFLPNLHGTAIIIGDRGVLIRGASGSGKTTLALALLTVSRNAGRHATLVADDQVLVAPRENRLICLAPPRIAGLVEVRGLTPRPVAHAQSAVIDLLVSLVEETDAPRYSEDCWSEIAGCRLLELMLPSRNVNGALAALAVCLSLPPFD
ncbi:HPr kinase/phosphorylase [Mesorhizobium sp. CN2-181]|uniref:HPr kinase/phosphorylase n=1 Tax=Mesorhizobium yinganensis TaxID=3157707 RepID=UPI0032B74947